MPAQTITLLLTRPRAASERFAAQLAPDLPEGVEVVIAPLIEIVPTGQAPDLSEVRGVIFSSANGVQHGGESADIPAYCVGARTAEAARRAGWPARCVGGTAHELIEALTREKPPAPMLHIAPVHRRGDIAERLSSAGLETRQIEVYDQRPCALSQAARDALSGPGPVVAPLMSPRTAALFSAQVSDRTGLSLVAISNAVVEELSNFPLANISCAASPDGENMRNATLRALGRVEDRGSAH